MGPSLCPHGRQCRSVGRRKAQPKIITRREPQENQHSLFGEARCDALGQWSKLPNGSAHGGSPWRLMSARPRLDKTSPSTSRRWPASHEHGQKAVDQLRGEVHQQAYKAEDPYAAWDPSQRYTVALGTSAVHACRVRARMPGTFVAVLPTKRYSTSDCTDRYSNRVPAG